MTAATAEDLVRAAIAEKGRITFAEYMEIALYAPGAGYYTASPRHCDDSEEPAVRHSRASGNLAPEPHTGPPQDYYTSPQLHAVFGMYLARQVAQVWQELGEPQHYDVVEMGAGRGILAWDILRSLHETNPRCWECTHYYLIERGRGPVAKQLEAVADVSAHPVHIGHELSAPVSGVVLSNELLDALPVHRLRFKNGALQELYVTGNEGRLTEEHDGPSCPELADYAERLGRPPDGWQGEICLAALAWLKSVAENLIRGTVITIDYGATWEELCGPRHAGGTLACYYRHGVSKNPYDRIGIQDITAHVNFSALMEFGEQSGLRTVNYQSQAEYLLELGIGEEMSSLARKPATAETLRAKRAITDLIWPDGLGGFRVLVQQKGVLY